MIATPGDAVLDTGARRFPLHEYRLRLAGREWRTLHTGEVLTFVEEQRFLGDRDTGPPYGAVLWPSAIALAHDLAARTDALRGRRVLELGAGTGLPGIVAASFGAQVVQTDRDALAVQLCARNGARNRVAVEHRVADWTAWDDVGPYDYLIGADILYGEGMHAHLRRIFDAACAPGGRVLLADPFRRASLQLLESMEADGWAVTFGTWRVGDPPPGEPASRPIAVFELTPPVAGSPG